MKPLSKLLNKFCGKMIMLLASLLIELIILIQKLRESRPISTRQYLKLIEKKNPTICYTKRLNLKAEHAATATECRVCLSEFEEGEKVLPDDVVFKHRLHQNQAEAASNNGNDDNLLYLFSAFRGGNT
ncbi:hypothetical protein JHK84_032427 [Glycine max]|nr:hypothetical protein JHK84_032427 [Glycine max]